ncbi:Uu.00g043860.m01.CDS01 [Anthostomella pinea]|uniref:Uu.00g043860.m01.CDS01 n=1 Tax=Anthostomella pinea TaxID=933095 RepID=A0AAI8V5U4_9PEZI|nr:Uu.00g043860.m01.CDS01 [Anthostomella pinea]
MLSSTLLVALSAALVAASPVWPRFTVANEHFEVLAMRASTEVNPDAASDVTCIDPNATIAFHDQNVAELGICGGIAGSITKCQGAPTSTVGESATAKFSLNAVTPGATINVSKGRWEQCVRAAQAVCPTGSLSATCAGGASSGDVAFTLDSTA